MPWQILDHLCRVCLGRILMSLEDARYRCACCGRESAALSEVCCCGIQEAGLRYACERNPAAPGEAKYQEIRVKVGA